MREISGRLFITARSGNVVYTAGLCFFLFLVEGGARDNLLSYRKAIKAGGYFGAGECEFRGKMNAGRVGEFIRSLLE